MTLSEALAKMEAAELRADHMPKTRESYRRVFVDYAGLLKAGTIDGPQSYVDFLADIRKLHSLTIRKTLSPLHRLPIARRGTRPLSGSRAGSICHRWGTRSAAMPAPGPCTRSSADRGR